ncbi:hypothetical protein [Pseudomonas yamanorum]|uniref:hypothetical protein n=1 Tax=Pseudomonas yamanorum TaxID=515393 RepID=UPI003F75532E
MTLSTSNLTNAGAPAITLPSANPTPPVASLPPVNLPAGNTRAEGDRVLARNLCDASKSGFKFDRKITVPPNSTMGQWQAQLNSALKNPDFRNWLATQGIHPRSITIYPDVGQLRANNDQKVFTLDDLSGWRDVAGPILAAGKIFAGGNNMSVQGDTIENDQVPYWMVANFYRQGTDRTSIAELASTYTFAPLPQSVAASRSEEALQTQRAVVGDINDRDALWQKIAVRVYLPPQLSGFVVDPNSSHQPKGFTRAEDFITSKGWRLPTTDEGFANLMKVLRAPVPQSPLLGDLWGFLSTPVPLNTAQKNQLRALARASKAPGQATLLSTLARPGNTGSPREQLLQLLDQPAAQALGEKLEAALGVLPTPTSRRELVLAAMVLQLDADAGDPRNQVAGYQVDHPSNWGKKPAEIVRAVGDRLHERVGVQPEHKDVAAYLMLSHIAPALLVEGLPAELGYQSLEWPAFAHAVSKIEHLTPGASTTMSYSQILDFATRDPITDDEEQLDRYTQRVSIIDWAVTNGYLSKKDHGIYLADEINAAKAAYQKVFSDLAFAGKHLLKPLPTRRQVALDDLKRVFEPQYGKDSIDFNAPKLQSIDGSQNHFFSLLEAHMDGLLVKGEWKSINKGVLDLQKLEPDFHLLRSMPGHFKSESNEHHEKLQQSQTILVKHLLSQLPDADRQHLQLGTQKFYWLRKAMSGTSHMVTTNRDGLENAKGRHGIIIRSEHDKDVRYYEVFPGLNKIVVRTDLPDHLNVGSNIKPFSNFESNESQRFDWNAYRNGTEPVRGAESDLIIEELTPETTWTPQPNEKAPALSYSNSKTEYLASVAAKQHFVLPLDLYTRINSGESAIQQQRRYAEAGAAATLNLIPFANTIKHAIEGNAAEAIGSFLIDATTLVLPAPKGLGSALRHGAKSLNTLRVMLSKATPYTDDLVGLVAGSGKNAKSFYSTIPPFGHKFSVSNTLHKEANVAKGTMRSIRDSTERTAVLAKYEGDKWYAVNPNSGTAYGTPLQDFRSDTSVPLLRETLPDGTRVQFSEKTLSKDTYIINRSNGYDLVEGDKVYRYDPAHPDRLTDLKSAEHYKELDNFEAYCPAPSTGGRVRRGFNDLCFPKIIKQKLSNPAQVSQALEHQRLFPAPIRYNGTRTVVYEGRLFNVVDDKLIPHPFTTPIQYKPAISGTIVNDKFFGFPDSNFSNELNADSRVIKFDAISDISNDKRELRGLIVPSGGKKYLVVEVDPGRFYCRDLDRDTDLFTKIEFGKSPNDHLIYGYENIKAKYLSKHSTSAADFISLPPIDSIYISLKSKGYSLDKMNKLKAGVATMTPERQREFIFNMWNKGSVRDIEIALASVRLPTLKKPADFNTLTIPEKNGFFAREAKNEVDKQIATTGVGPANLHLTGDIADAQRVKTSKSLTAWLYEKFDPSNDAFFNTILKTGAGNCDHMAHTAAKIIQMNGGKARVMGMPDKHAFTVVGDISPNVKTVDFSEPAWKDIWISDPWAEIECPAPEYMKKFKDKMLEWKAKGQAIRGNDGVWINADDPAWLKGTIDAVKTFD